MKVSGSRLPFAGRASRMRKGSCGKTIYGLQEATVREVHEIRCSLARKHTRFHNDRFIIFNLSSNTEGCIRDLPFSALNNLSQAATCEIIELTRIYGSRWSSSLLLGLWVMTMSHHTSIVQKVRAHSSLICHFHSVLWFSSALAWSSSLRQESLQWLGIIFKN